MVMKKEEKVASDEHFYFQSHRPCGYQMVCAVCLPADPVPAVPQR